jgi:hypothetical protein
MSSKFRSRIRKNAGLLRFARILANAATWKLFLDGYEVSQQRLDGFLQHVANDLAELVRRRLGHRLSFNPEPSLMQGDPVLTVFPLHVSVSRLFKRVRAEAGRDRQLAEPFVYRDIDPIRCRIPHDKAQASPVGGPGA